EQAAAQCHGRADRAGRSAAGAASRFRPRHGRRSSHRLHLPGGHLLQWIHPGGGSRLGPDLAAAVARGPAAAGPGGAAATATADATTEVLVMVKAIRFEK